MSVVEIQPHWKQSTRAVGVGDRGRAKGESYKAPNLLPHEMPFCMLLIQFISRMYYPNTDIQNLPRAHRADVGAFTD